MEYETVIKLRKSARERAAGVWGQEATVRSIKQAFKTFLKTAWRKDFSTRCMYCLRPEREYPEAEWISRSYATMAAGHIEPWAAIHVPRTMAALPPPKSTVHMKETN